MYIQDMHINATNGCGFHTGLYKQNFGRVFPYSESKKRRKKKCGSDDRGTTYTRTCVIIETRNTSFAWAKRPLKID